MADNSSECCSSSYFIVKCMTIENLIKCIETVDWACRDRVKPPHPRHSLVSAHKKGRVILIFSVNNQHGWHGFCESLFHLSSPNYQCATESPPENEYNIDRQNTACDHLGSENTNPNLISSCSDTTGETTVVETSSEEWHHFKVKWITHFQMFSKLECLPSVHTNHLGLQDGSPLNKARNWQEVHHEVGKEVCSLIQSHYDELMLKHRVAQEQQSLKEQSFFKTEEENLTSEMQDSPWSAIIMKVERELGRVHLACPFGSQRYNCSQSDSDNDVFLVYQAKTTDILGLDPPKQTIKNSNHAMVDYTVLELQRYCELLVSGDPRCVETLFLDQDSVLVKASGEWNTLKAFRECLLTRTCFDKYMKECQGTTGLKHLHKWHKNNDAAQQLSPKMNKLGYIVLRLLQSARDLVADKTLHVYRVTDSEQHKELLTVRQGGYCYSDLMDLFDRYFKQIETLEDSIQQDSTEGKSRVQQWLIDRRIQDLHLDN